jgi:hypothetical protein
MKLSHCLIPSLVAIVTLFLAAHAQEPGKPLPETRIVLRVAGEFIQGPSSATSRSTKMSTESP